MKIAVTLPASDIKRARDWYASVLQLEPTEETSDGSLWYEADNGPFMVYPSQFAGSNQATAAAFGTEDVEAKVKELRARGAVFEDYDFGEDFRTVDGILTDSDGQKIAWFKDSEGNILSVGPDPEQGRS